MTEELLPGIVSDAAEALDRLYPGWWWDVPTETEGDGPLLRMTLGAVSADGCGCVGAWITHHRLDEDGWFHKAVDPVVLDDPSLEAAFVAPYESLLDDDEWWTAAVEPLWVAEIEYRRWRDLGRREQT